MRGVHHETAAENAKTVALGFASLEIEIGRATRIANPVPLYSPSRAKSFSLKAATRWGCGAPESGL